MRKFGIAFALILFVFGQLSRRVLSQSSASVVEGVVQDGTNAVIQNCEVTFLNTETGGKLITSTNADGVYAFLSVQPGAYSLEVSKKGFKSYSISNFKVTVSQRATQNVVLGLGSASATVTVDASGSFSLSEPTSNELGTLIEQVNVRELPLNGRDFLQLGLLSGATQTSGTTVSDFTTLQVGHPDRTIIIAGNEQDLTGFTINGISTAGSRLGQASLNLSVAAIDQFKIRQGFFLPSEGPNDAGVVSVVTKGGGNHFHGKAFEFIRNTAFDTRQFFDPPGAKPSPFHRNQFGGAVGGPILRNRVFFFTHFESRRQVLSNAVKATVLSGKMFRGDFSELGTTNYDPTTYDLSTGKRQPSLAISFRRALSTIWRKSCLPIMCPLQVTHLKTSWATRSPQTTTTNMGGRVDVSLNAKNILFGQYVKENAPTVNAALFPLAGYGFPLSTNFVMAQLTSTLTPHLVNEFRPGFLYTLIFNAGATYTDVQGKIGFTGTADPDGVPGIYLSGLTSLALPQRPLRSAAPKV